MRIPKCMAVFGTICLLASLALRLHSESKSYDLSENQKLRLQVKQKDAQLAQMQLSIAQSGFQKTIDDFNAEVKAIEKENSWPETLQVNPQNLTFSEPPAPPKEKPEQKKP